MNPKIRRINPEMPESNLIDMAVEILKNGGMVVSPSETRYGLLARADRKETIDKVYKIKRRLRRKPLSVFVASPEKIEAIAVHTDLSRRLAKKRLPGPLTLVLQANENALSDIIVDGKIGIRCSSSAVISAIMERVDFCLTATSANKSGDETADTINAITADLGDEVDLYLDVGPLDNPGSTVVDCTSGMLKILREGAITEAQLKQSVMEN